jgi:hypothetical protein
MTLKNIDEDIPVALVQRYNDCSRPYVDEGNAAFLPLLLVYNEHVARTTNGFQARQRGSIGLGLILVEEERADFDAKGVLVKEEEEAAWLTGLLLAGRETEVREGAGRKKGRAWSTLWGAVGYESDVTGDRYLTVLWIPIRVGRGAASR